MIQVSMIENGLNTTGKDSRLETMWVGYEIIHPPIDVVVGMEENPKIFYLHINIELMKVRVKDFVSVHPIMCKEGMEENLENLIVDMEELVIDFRRFLLLMNEIGMG